jgi:hypothetical protein
MPRPGRAARILVLAAAGVGLVGLGGGCSSTAPPATALGPATATLTFTGDPGLAGPATKAQVSCNFPKPDGSLTIFVLDQPSEPAAVFNMHVSAGKVSVGVYSGSGTGFRGRNFQGSGVTGFDAAKGARIDSTLTEVTGSGDNPGPLGAITSIKGVIDCGSQTPGTSTITLSGDTAEGSVNGGLHPFRAECDTSASIGNRVFLVGAGRVGSAKALFEITFATDAITIFEFVVGTPGASHSYAVKGAGVATLTANGAHVAGDAVEQAPTSGSAQAAAHTLHVVGSVTCGTTVHG